THQPGDEMSFEDVRYGTHLTMRVKLAEAPGEGNTAVAADDDAAASSDNSDGTVSSKSLGITFGPMSASGVSSHVHGIRGVVVTDVRRGGPADGELVPGDIITDVIHPAPKVATPTVSALQSALAKLKSGDYVGLELSRETDSQGDRSTAVVNLKLGS
ncbi:MAG TPA: PDZ domain-containing protein, partial [Gemmatimonadaceae bacterium]|nr:PDZ domain-containing protein [Gemmatimonadaceae bacterium]